MNNKAFTLIELLATIIILSLLMVIAVPTISSITKTTRQSAYETKVKNIVTASKLYGQDNFGVIKKKTNSTVTITVADLITNGYLDTSTERVSGSFEDPRNPGKYLNSCKVTLVADTTTKDIEVSYNNDNSSNC